MYRKRVKLGTTFKAANTGGYTYRANSAGAFVAAGFANVPLRAVFAICEARCVCVHTRGTTFAISAVAFCSTAAPPERAAFAIGTICNP